jgi:hypothetical protein
VLSFFVVGLTTLGQPRLSEGAQPYPRKRDITPGETGNRKVSWGTHFRVTGDSHGSQPTRFRPSGFQLPASGSRLPMAGMPSREWLMP